MMCGETIPCGMILASCSPGVSCCFVITDTSLRGLDSSVSSGRCVKPMCCATGVLFRFLPWVLWWDVCSPCIIPSDEESIASSIAGGFLTAAPVRIMALDSTGSDRMEMLGLIDKVG